MYYTNEHIRAVDHQIKAKTYHSSRTSRVHCFRLGFALDMDCALMAPATLVCATVRLSTHCSDADKSNGDQRSWNGDDSFVGGWKCGRIGSEEIVADEEGVESFVHLIDVGVPLLRIKLRGEK
jgi:hypothetical protein